MESYNIKNLRQVGQMVSTLQYRRKWQSWRTAERRCLNEVQPLSSLTEITSIPSKWWKEHKTDIWKCIEQPRIKVSLMTRLTIMTYSGSSQLMPSQSALLICVNYYRNKFVAKSPEAAPVKLKIVKWYKK